MSTETASLVTGVDFVSIPTKDMAAMRDFYENVLGLEPGPLWQRPGDEEPVGAEFETGTVTISLINPTAVGREFRPHTQPIAFQVADVHEARERLEAQGVRFHMDTIDSGVCHMVPFSDPDGNVLMIHHRYRPRT